MHTRYPGDMYSMYMQKWTQCQIEWYRDNNLSLLPSHIEIYEAVFLCVTATSYNGDWAYTLSQTGGQRL